MIPILNIEMVTKIILQISLFFTTKIQFNSHMTAITVSTVDINLMAVMMETTATASTRRS